MRILKLIGETILRRTKQIWSLPQTATAALKERRHRIARHDLEVERLDRICNPSKYLGK